MRRWTAGGQGSAGVQKQQGARSLESQRGTATPTLQTDRQRYRDRETDRRHGGGWEGDMRRHRTQRMWNIWAMGNNFMWQEPKYFTNGINVSVSSLIQIKNRPGCEVACYVEYLPLFTSLMPELYSNTHSIICPSSRCDSKTSSKKMHLNGNDFLCDSLKAKKKKSCAAGAKNPNKSGGNFFEVMIKQQLTAC